MRYFLFLFKLMLFSNLAFSMYDIKNYIEIFNSIEQEIVDIKNSNFAQKKDRNRYYKLAKTTEKFFNNFKQNTLNIEEYQVTENGILTTIFSNKIDIDDKISITYYELYIFILHCESDAVFEFAGRSNLNFYDYTKEILNEANLVIENNADKNIAYKNLDAFFNVIKQDLFLHDFMRKVFYKSGYIDFICL